MKLHIFVATTQGLVAIQNIINIDDAEINSIVTVNGTSTTANISSAYHSFVKKGSGIVQQDFGGTSYRVNLSDRIDHGNSWQLAFYLAHVANKQGMLGNGEVKPNDHIICATGEINTSNRMVQSVQQVQLKQTLAKEKIEQWQQMSAEIAFLIPKDNEQDVEINLLKMTKLITTLDEALNYLPVLAASKQAMASEPNSTNIISMDKTELLANKSVMTNKKNTFKLKFFVGLLSVVVILVLLQTDFVFTKVNNGQLLELAKQSNSTIDDGQTSITATLAKYGNCADEVIQKKVKKQGNLFAATKLVNLCQLTLSTSSEIKTVILVAADTHAIRLLTHTTLVENSWKIPLPTIQNTDRHYYLVLVSNKKASNNEAQPTKQIDYQQQLQHYLQHETKSPLVKTSHLQQWLDNNNWHGTIVSHTLNTY